MSSAPSLTPALQDAVVQDAPAADACGNCPHPLSAHDAISLRFCRATQAGDLPRGCACPTA